MDWKISNDFQGTAEDEAKIIIDTKMSLHIDGVAGTGKTYLTNKIIDELKNQKIPYLAFSPTNKGARLINGETIDSCYNKFRHSKTKLYDALTKTEYIIIDEVSMMKEIFYQLFITIKMSFPHLKFILTGDYEQFEPVGDWYSGDYKNSPATFVLVNGNRLQLTKCRRSNLDLFKLYTNPQNILIGDFKPTQKTYLNLAYTHKTRITVNNDCMNRFLKENINVSVVEIPKDYYNEKTQDVKLCIGMPVITHTTNKKLNILNSETFVIEKINNDKITIIDETRKIEVETKMFHKYFYLGFCITLHASQGSTFNKPYTIYDWKFKHFSNRAKYVALSRGTSKENIQIHQ